MKPANNENTLGNSMKNHQSFEERLDGNFTGVLHWSQLGSLWKTTEEQGYPWYVYQVGLPLPNAPIQGEELSSALKELDALLHQEHDYDYCGIVYADDLENPTMIKVYDPNNLGSSCGCSGHRIPPRWIISQSPPEIIEDNAPIPNNRKRWWMKVFSRVQS